MTTTQAIIDIKHREFPRQWEDFEGIPVKRIAESPFLAIPVTGKKTSAYFDVVDIRGNREYVCQLRKNEVDMWLLTAHRAELAEAIEAQEEAAQIAAHRADELAEQARIASLQPSLFAL